MQFCSNETSRIRASVAGAMIAAAALGFITYAKAINNKFVYDDSAFILVHPLVNQTGPWYRFWLEPYWPRGLSADKLYRPLTLWSFRANVVLTGRDKPDPDDARAFHAVNVVLHALTCMGVALLAWRVTRRGWAAWLAGALFATHPLHTETVVTGYGRSELLAGLFAVWLMARYIRPWDQTVHGKAGFRVQGSEGEPGAAPAPRSEPSALKKARFHTVNALLLLLAVMSKEHALFVWPVLVLYDLWLYRHMDPEKGTGTFFWNGPRPAVEGYPASQKIFPTPFPRPRLRQWLNDVAAPAHAGFMLAVSAFFFLRYNVFGWHYRLENEYVRFWESPLAHANLIEHILTPFRLLWLTLKLTVWPAALCPVWSIPALPLANHLAPDVIAGALLLIGLVVLSVLMWRRGSPLGALLAGLLILLALPIQALPMAHWLYAERWMYLPSVLVAVLVAAGLVRLPVAGWALGLTAALALLPASWQYASKFADNMTLFQEVVNRQPDNFQGWRNLTKELCVEGDHDAAIQAAQETIRRFGNDISDPYAVLIVSYLAQGKGREALEAINTYEWTRRDIPEPSLEAQRQQAEALIAQQAAQSRPATSSTPATMPVHN